MQACGMYPLVGCFDRGKKPGVIMTKKNPKVFIHAASVNSKLSAPMAFGGDLTDLTPLGMNLLQYELTVVSNHANASR